MHRFQKHHVEHTLQNESQYVRRRGKTLVENFGKKFDATIKSEGDIIEKLLIHGDYWPNNIMYNQNSSDCLVVDWQFLATGSIFYDLGILIYFGLSNDKNSDHAVKELFAVFYREFVATCKALNVAVPSSAWGASEAAFVEVARVLALKWALYYTILNAHHVEQYPSFAKRFLFIVRKSISVFPEFFASE